MRYLSPSDAQRNGADRIGILLVNSGTPASPEPRDVRHYLARFLGDPRIVETSRALWLPILYGIVLPLRPARSARKYRKIWSTAGSPLLAFSEQLTAQLQGALSKDAPVPCSVELGMLYSEPSVGQALQRLRDSGARRILVVPMFPQYSGATTGAVYDQVNQELRRWRWLPELRFISEYHDEPGYIDALRASVSRHWSEHGRSQHLLISFHGIPERYCELGDPYSLRAHETARLLANQLLLKEGEWSVGFQSRFGPTQWLRPYTSEVLSGMPARGVRQISVVCPGFAVDCLETLEEIAMENRDLFLRAGGERFQYIPALNADAEHVRFLSALVARHCQGWTSADSGRRS